MTRVLVTGGRDYDDRDRVYAELDNAFRASTDQFAFKVIQGGATGADALARLWCRFYRVPCDSFPADWTAHGRAAGPIRNARMIAESNPDLVIAFPGGRGTADMVRRAKAAGIPIREVR